MSKKMMTFADDNADYYVYFVSAVDYWDGWLSYPEMLSLAVRHFEPGLTETEDELVEHIEKTAGFLRRLLSKAELAAHTLGWEGDVREGPYFSVVPDPPNSLVMVAWKQDNNGDTVIASPVPLPHLEKHLL